MEKGKTLKQFQVVFTADKPRTIAQDAVGFVDY
jgi:hypothetical protein